MSIVPLLDIKPYSHRFDCLEGTRNGWQDEVAEPDARLRGRRNCPPATRAGQGKGIDSRRAIV